MLKTDRNELEQASQKDNESAPITRGSRGSNASVAARAAAARSARQQGSGTPMGESARAPMEASFGSDFSDVRIHEGKLDGARAVTRGTDIHFAAGQYDPASPGGRELLGHELAHVVQQRQGRASGAQAKGEVSANDGLEREADVAGEKAARGERTGMAPTSGKVSSAVAQAKLNESRSSMATAQRGKSLVTFARILDKLDQYHRIEGLPKKSPQQLASLAKLLEHIAKLCSSWLVKNKDAPSRGRIEQLAGQARKELAATRVAAKRAAIASKIVKAPTKDNRGKSLSWAGKDGPLQGKAKADKYKDEDKKLGWRTQKQENKNLDHVVTRYDQSPVLRARSHLRANAFGQGDSLRMGMYEQFNRDGLGWVMDPENANVHGFEMNKATVVDRKTGKSELLPFGVARAKVMENRARFQLRIHHHTSPLAGRDVAGAGSMKIKDGSISKITDQSGHYAPEAEYTHQAVAAMEKQGLPMKRGDDDEQKSAKVSLTGYDEILGSGKGWINEHNKDAKPDQKMYAGELTLPYQAFLTSQGNERQMRLKSTLNDQIKKKQPEVAPIEPKVAPPKKQESQSGGYAQLDQLMQEKAQQPPQAQQPQQQSGGYAQLDTLMQDKAQQPQQPQQKPTSYVQMDDSGQLQPTQQAQQQPQQPSKYIDMEESSSSPMYKTEDELGGDSTSKYKYLQTVTAGDLYKYSEQELDSGTSPSGTSSSGGYTTEESLQEEKPSGTPYNYEELE
jgi:hypothetical protein